LTFGTTIATVRCMIDDLVAALRHAYPEISIEQVRVSHPGADDDGVWFVRHPRGLTEVQIESSTGRPPFLIESELAPPTRASTIEAAVRLVGDRLGLSFDSA